MKIERLSVALLLAASVTAQMAPPTVGKPGPNFSIKDADLPSPLTFILYGDQRFMDPKNDSQSSPAMRQLLVKKIAEEKPGAIILNGDVPNNGLIKEDYAVYQSETQIWRDEKLPIFPALGNHEINGDEKECLENWWTAFPELRDLRWYSVQLGSRVYVLALDSQSPLAARQPASEMDRSANLPHAHHRRFLDHHHAPSARRRCANSLAGESQSPPQRNSPARLPSPQGTQNARPHLSQRRTHS